MVRVDIKLGPLLLVLHHLHVKMWFGLKFYCGQLLVGERVLKTDGYFHLERIKHCLCIVVCKFSKEL